MHPPPLCRWLDVMLLSHVLCERVGSRKRLVTFCTDVTSRSLDSRSVATHLPESRQMAFLPCVIEYGRSARIDLSVQAPCVNRSSSCTGSWICEPRCELACHSAYTPTWQLAMYALLWMCSTSPESDEKLSKQPSHSHLALSLPVDAASSVAGGSTA